MSRDSHEPDTSPEKSSFIPLWEPEIRGNERRYLEECLETNWLSSAGPFVDRFEQMVSLRLGVRNAVATSSGTAALHLALIVSGIERGDEVLLPSLSFIAPAFAVRYVGAVPVFIDVEPNYWQLDPQKLEDFLAHACQWVSGELRNRTTGNRVKAVVPVHLLGHPVDLDAIMEVAGRFELEVVEDAAESLGALYRESSVGSSGNLVCLSFNGNKTATCGGGGMVVCNRDDLAERARHLSTQAKEDPVGSVHNELGFNYRLSNLHAAVGCAQIERLDELLRAKRQIARSYGEAFAGRIGITAMAEAPWAWSTFWLYTILVDELQFGTSNRALMKKLDDRGIQSRPLWQPLHTSPAFPGCQSTDCSTAERIHQMALSLPSSAGLDSESLKRVLRAVLD